MGYMKEYLISKVAEYALLHGLHEEDVYKDNDLYALASEYAQEQLRKEVNTNGRTNKETS